MRKQEPRSFAPVNDDELPEDVRNFTRLFRTAPEEPDPKPVRRPKPHPDERPRH